MMNIDTVLLPRELKNSDLKEWREAMYKLCPDPCSGELVSTLFQGGEYYGYVCQKAAGYHSHWVRVCIDNLEDLFEKKLLNFFIEHEFKVKHKTGMLLVVSFNSNRLRVYRSTPPFEGLDTQKLFSDCWNRWERVDQKMIVGAPKNIIKAYGLSIVNQCFVDTKNVIYKAAWTAKGRPAMTEQLARNISVAQVHLPRYSEGVYLGDGVYIVPDDAWL